MATRVESQPPGDTGLFSFDWTDALAAVAGDSLSGTPTVTAAPAGLTITAVQQVGALTNFLASASTAAAYTVTTRGGLTPSGRSLSQSFALLVGLPPAVEPVTLAEARAQLRLDATGTPATHPDDDLLLSLITAARQHAENETGRTLITTAVVEEWDTWWKRYARHRRYDQALARHPLHASSIQPLVLGRSPVQSVTSVQYIGADGVLAVLDPSTYVADLIGDVRGGMSRLAPAVGSFWPPLALQIAAVTISYVAGPPAAIPELLRRAVLQLVAHWYEFRGPVATGSVGAVPGTVDAMLANFCVPNV
jgi:uncharacterized phiE125 gp8 family phage protein